MAKNRVTNLFLIVLFLVSGNAFAQARYLLSWTDGTKIVLTEITKSSTGAFTTRTIAEISDGKRVGNTAVIANFDQANHVNTHLYYNYVGATSQLLSKLTISPTGEVLGEKQQGLKPKKTGYHILQVWESDNGKRYLYLPIGTDLFNVLLNSSGDTTPTKKKIFDNPAADAPLGASISSHSVAGNITSGQIKDCYEQCNSNSGQGFAECMNGCLNPDAFTKDVDDEGGAGPSTDVDLEDGVEPASLTIANNPSNTRANAGGKQSPALLTRMMAYRVFNFTSPRKSRIFLQMLSESGAAQGAAKALTNFINAPLVAAEVFQSVDLAPDGTFILYTVYSSVCKRQIIKIQRLNSATGTKIGGPKELIGCSQSSANTVGPYGLNTWSLQP